MEDEAEAAVPKKKKKIAKEWLTDTIGWVYPYVQSIYIY